MCCPRKHYRRDTTIAVTVLTADIKTSTADVAPKQPPVTFSKTVEGCFTTSMIDYTDDEIYACWYSPKDFDDIQEDLQCQLQQMEEGNPLGADSCSRGLERYLTLNAISKEHNVRKAVQVVLELQDRQSKLETFDQQAISKAYQNVSSSCHLWAAVVGLRDRQEAACAYNDDDDYNEL
ncbi:MAG: hypothetical protein SGBAC_011195 [Bacillariaceae sp.]